MKLTLALLFLITQVCLSQIHYIESHVLSSFPNNYYLNSENKNLLYSVDKDGNLLIGAPFTFDIKFDDQTFFPNTTGSGAPDYFLGFLPVNADTLEYYKVIGNRYTDLISDIQFDQKGNFYVSGIFSGTLEIDTLILVGSGDTSSPSFIYPDFYLAKFSKSGVAIWSKNNRNNYAASDIVTDSTNKVFFSLDFQDTLIIDNHSLVSRDSTQMGPFSPIFKYGDISIWGFSENGSFLFANQIGGLGPETSYKLGVFDSSYNVIGETWDTLHINGTIAGPGLSVSYSKTSNNVKSVAENSEGKYFQSFLKDGGNLNSLYGRFVNFFGCPSPNILAPVGIPSGNFELTTYKRNSPKWCIDEVKEYLGPSPVSTIPPGIFYSSEDLNEHYLFMEHDLGQQIDSGFYFASYSLSPFDPDQMVCKTGIDFDFDVLSLKAQNGYIYLIDSFYQSKKVFGDSLVSHFPTGFNQFSFSISKFIDCNTFADGATINYSNDSLFAPYKYEQYTWFKNLIEIPNSNSYKIKLDGPGDYFFSITNSDSNCVRLSPELTISNLEMPGKDNFRIYPNPTNGMLTLEIIHRLGASNSGQVQIFDISGKQVHNSKLTYTKTELNMEALPSGLYLAKVVVNGAIYSQKIVKQ